MIASPRRAVGERAPDLFANERRQSFGGLVEEQQPRVGHQGAADREHLLLAAGELAARMLPRAPARPGNSASTRGGVQALAPVVAGRGERAQVLSTLRLGKTCRPSGTSATPSRAMRFGGQPATRRRRNATLPALGRSGPSASATSRRLAHAVPAEQRRRPRRRRRRGRCRTAPGSRRSPHAGRDLEQRASHQRCSSPR